MMERLGFELGVIFMLIYTDFCVGADMHEISTFRVIAEPIRLLMSVL